VIGLNLSKKFCQLLSPGQRFSIRRPGGFSLVELLAVIAIICVLAGFILPSLFRARARARQAVCVVQLRQLALAVRAYSDDFEGVFPTSLYSATFAHYYNNESALTLCPDEDRDLSSGIPRGSYGLGALTSYRLTNIPEIHPVTGHPVVIVGDCLEEDLTEANFSPRHRGVGNLGFLDGHVEPKTAAQAADYL
jgi:prepilin-type N-terminal cleavage/methylation domain-containing protein/prepilin-type processing-associated H-X9-DG protein